MASLKEIANNIQDLLESEDLDQVANTFLSFVPAARLERTQNSLWRIFTAYKEGAIFNADFQTWKLTVDRSFEEAYDEVVTPPGYYWEQGAQDWNSKKKSLKGQVADEIGTHTQGVRGSISIQKKLLKLKIQDPHVDNVKRLVAAGAAVAQIFEKVKGMVVKGKKPLSAEKQAAKQAQLAKKNVQTCACCFRSIATLPNGNIADHGYTLPHPGLKSSSCPGGMFKPLEVSDAGLKYMVKQYQQWIDQGEEALKRAPNLTKLRKTSYSSKQGVEVAKGEIGWDSLYKAHVLELERGIERDKEQLKLFKLKVSTWKPQVTESLVYVSRKLRTLTS